MCLQLVNEYASVRSYLIHEAQGWPGRPVQFSPGQASPVQETKPTDELHFVDSPD